MNAEAEVNEHRLPSAPMNPEPADQTKRTRRGFSLRYLKTQGERPRRRAAWRWNIAGELLASGQRAPRVAADPLFAEVVGFRRLLEQAVSKKKLADVEYRHPALFQAWQLHELNGLRRWKLEARILADQAPDEIASLEGLSVEIVELYEAVYFDVRSRLDAPYLMIAVGIGPRYHERLEAGDVEVVLKAFGYFRGPRILEHILSNAVDEEGRFRPLDLRHLKTAKGRTAAAAQVAVATMIGPADLKRFDELIRIQHLILDAEHAYAKKSKRVAPFSVDLTAFPASPTVEIEPADVTASMPQSQSEALPTTAEDSEREAGEAA